MDNKMKFNEEFRNLMKKYKIRQYFGIFDSDSEENTILCSAERGWAKKTCKKVFESPYIYGEK